MIRSILSAQSKIIEVYHREQKKNFIEVIYGDDAMKIFQGTKLGFRFTDKFLTNQTLSRLYGAYNDSSLSKRKIKKCADLLKIDLDELEKSLSEFTSFNDFFTRTLKPEARPIDSLPNSFSSPGDGRLLVFPKLDDDLLSYVKWAPIRLKDLFQHDEALIKRYRDGACGILRLCPTDYHRFHFPVKGKAGITRTIKGVLHSVSPYTLENKVPVYTLNKRTVCEVETASYGKVLLMEVGALFVGGIMQTYRPGYEVNKGEEKGFFKFGGSTCIFFLQKGVMEFDEDLIFQSKLGRETYVKMGEKIGTLKAK